MLRIRRSRKPLNIEPPIWPARGGRGRVLVENPDGAELWAPAEALREAGYDVARCFGPSAQARVVCPLVTEGHCAAVEDADVVISTTSIHDDGALVTTLYERHPRGLIVERGDGLSIEQKRLLAAVEAAMAEVDR